MICWGSWANTQKLAAGSWRFELFYWDYVFGVLLLSLVLHLRLAAAAVAEETLWMTLHRQITIIFYQQLLEA